MSPPLLLEFGSRTGSWFALGLFAALFGALGWGVSLELRRRSSTVGRRLPLAAGWLVGAGPLVLIYVSSLGGFYEAEIDRRVVRLRYLVPAVEHEIQLGDVTAVEAVPAFRGRWRLRIVAASGARYESALTSREPVLTSSAALNNARP